MKKTVKILSLLLTMVLTLSIFTSCSQKKEVSSGSTLTYWASPTSQVTQTLTSFSEMLMYQEINKATGINVEFIHPSQGTSGSEAFQILLASADFPDIIEYNWSSYAGGPDRAIEEGVIISLNDYLEEYAPNYYNYMEGEYGKEKDYIYRRQSTTEQGNYYGFKNLAIGSYRGFGGFYVRKDLIDKWGMDIPQTIDDWEMVFEKAKSEGFEVPFTCQNMVFSPSSEDINAFNSAYGVGKGFYLDGENVKFGPFEANYKNYIEKLASWTKKGYIDKDFVTNDNSNIAAYMANGKSVASWGFVGSGLGTIIPAVKQNYPDSEFELAACPFPVLKKGDIPRFQNYCDESIEPAAAISKQCGENDEQRYKDAVRWCDYPYSEEGKILCSFGVEGVTYTKEKDEDGNVHYVYTDAIIDHEKIGAHSIEAALYHFFRPGNGPGLKQHPDYLNGFYQYDAQKDAIKIWNEHVEESRGTYFPKAVSFNDEESTRIAELTSYAQDNLIAGITNIILGKQSMDEYDSIVKKAKKDGYGELLKIYQSAYSRYLKK